MIRLDKYSFGIGDRFGHQGRAQLKAILKARNLGVDLIPVWNKSNREHQIIGTKPSDVRKEADQAVQDLGYTGPYYVDADHVNLDTVDSYVESSDFFTIDVAASIGVPPEKMPLEVLGLIHRLGSVVTLEDGTKLMISEEIVTRFINNYYTACQSAAMLYQHIEKRKGSDNFVPEVSMDEVEYPQTPTDLLLILVVLSELGVPVQTIAPKFTGRFNKGVDYQGDIAAFRNEFEADLLVLKYAVQHLNLPDNLKLSIHSGSDKFSIYPIMGELLRTHDCGIHVKTAGTTWLEELIGLCLGDEQSIDFVRNLYHDALKRNEELCGPYAEVIDINPSKLPSDLSGLSGEEIANMLRHIPDHPHYDAQVRQLFHVGYKLAAEEKSVFYQLLDKHEAVIALQVEENIYDRHLTRLFG